MDKLDYIKIRYCSSKDIMKMKKQGRWKITVITTPKIYFLCYKYFLKTIKKTTQQRNRQNWVFNKISRYPINLLKSAISLSPGKCKNQNEILLYKPTRMLQLKIVTISNASENVEEMGFSFTTGRTVKQYHFGKLFLQHLLKLNKCIPYDPVIPFLGICNINVYMYISKDMYRNVRNIICNIQ